MINKKKIFLFALVLNLLTVNIKTKAQTTSKIDLSNFSTTGQPMFGSGFNLNFEIPIFHVPWNSSFGPAGGIADPGFGLGQYGFEISGGSLGNIGAKLYSRNWSGGDIGVDYPVDIKLTYPSDFTFNRGDKININSSYTLNSNAKIKSQFPAAGNVGLEMYFLMRFWLNPRICFYSCISPGFDTGDLGTTLTIFDVSPNQATYAWPPEAPDYSLTRTENILPLALPENDFGFEGELDLPNVTTSSQILNNKCLRATGEDDYANINVDVFDFIGGLKIPYISTALGALDDDACFLGDQICLSYTLLSATFGVYNYNKQRFNFCPTIYSSVGFPSPVLYEVKDVNNNIIEQGQSDTIRFEVGNNVDVTYPCNYESMETSSKYDLENTFSNNTYDSIAFNFTLEAMAVGLRIEGFSTPGLYIDLPCVFYYPVFSGWSIRWKCGFDPPGFWAPPAISLGPWEFNVGPLYSQTFPLGGLPGIPWYNNSWELEGFTEQNGTNFTLKPKEFKAEIIAKSDVSCKGESDGMMQVQITNGVAPFTYYWSNGSSNTSSLRTESNNSMPAGIQFVMIEDNNGCQVVVDTLIIEPADSLHLLTSTVNNVNCNGLATGSILTNFSGGNTTYSYAWTPNISTSSNANNLSAGIYQITTTDEKGCSSSASFTITEPSALSLSISADSVSCFNGNNGSASSLVSGGTYPFSYNWSSGSSSDTAAGLSPGNYNLTVTDLNGCLISDSFNILEPTEIIYSSQSSDVNCKGGNDGTISISSSGGSGSHLFQWYSDQPSLLATTTNNINNLNAGSYIFYLRDQNNCLKSDTIYIDEPVDAISSIMTSTNVTCFNFSDGAIDLTVSGGTSPYDYLWTNGANSEDLGSLSEGNYSVTITDNNGCVLLDSLTITQPTEITQQNGFSDVGCFGESTGNITYDISGGTPPYNYLWNNGITTNNNNNLSAGTYSVISTDNNGCTIKDTVIISQPSAPISITGNTIEVSCINGGDGSIDILVNGGTLPYIYNWFDGNSVIINNNSNQLNNLSAGPYNINLVDSNNCQLDTVFFVNEPSSPLELSLISTDVNCFGEASGSINSNILGGTPPYSYDWSNSSSTPNISLLVAGNYSLTVYDDNNCRISDSIMINEPSLPLTAVSSSSDVNCQGGADGSANIIPYGGTPGYTFSWSNGMQSEEIKELSAGSYTVIITDLNGCIFNDSIVINEPSSYVQFDNIIMDSVSCFGYNDGSISIRASQGTTPYTVYFGDSIFNLYNSANDYSASNLAAGNVHINIIDNNGCHLDTNITVLEPDTLLYDFTILDVDCYGNSTGEIELDVSGGTPSYKYFWSNGLTTKNISSLLANNYSVVVKDNNDCMIEASAIVYQPDPIGIQMYISEVSCRDDNDGFIELRAIGGVPEYEYLWSNQSVSNNIYDLLPGQYIITIEDNNGCIKIDTLYVNYKDIECISPATVFTPDADGINDTWILDKIELYPNAVVQIYNQWGQMVYETKGSYIPWNGKKNGIGPILPANTYFYIIDLKNNTPAYTGTITILKSKN